MRNIFTTRLISMLLVLALVLGFALPVSAVENNGIYFGKTDNSAVSNPLRPQQTESHITPTYDDNDVVRVSIVLTGTPTLQAGYSTKNISNNVQAMAYRSNLKKEQASVTARIENSIGNKLDVVWNLTLATNLISANVKYGQIQAIANTVGVKDVVLETRYDPMKAVSSTEDKPNMLVSANMTGATHVWETGYTGGGTRIAVIDTGLDTDHQSFDPEALEYALKENAALAGVSYDEYLAGLNLLDVAEIEAKLSRLNVAERSPELTAEDLYMNLKAPFGYNYVDVDTDMTHDNDSEGSHGSHVAGISAANRYIKRGNEFVSAATTIAMQGNAPDAQIVVMKVFGKMGGTYESDYMAAVEDAIILDCDAINLSLGSASAGFTVPSERYQELMNYLVETESVVSMASGNSGNWAVYSSGAIGNLYAEDVNLQTAGSPSTYKNSLSVASVENDGYVGASIIVAGEGFGFRDGDGFYNLPMASLDSNGEGTDYEYVFIDGIGVVSDYAGIDVRGKIVFVSRGEINFAEKAQVAYNCGAVGIVVYNNEIEAINMMLDGYYEEAPCVIISMAWGQYVREHSQTATTNSGVTYYTGMLTIKGTGCVNLENSPYYTMSGFSSWGVPGDLSLKPEITAPGGNIYSINGNIPETDQYELMSGTSMATPQISGFAAIMKQVVRERKLSQNGMTDRALIQSILMSTATPLKDVSGQYYSVLQQGAGLVDILAATTADSYILVNGQEDGKVKVELGDDPMRTGVYSFTFSVNNLTDADKTYTLSAAMFTQDLFWYYANIDAATYEDVNNLALYMDTATIGMDFVADWSSDALLNGNQLLVSANGSEEVTVTLTLTPEQKEYLDAYYVNGAYVEAYVYVDGEADAEGVDGTCHSIPVLGFYGNWSDPSMYEKGNAQTHATGEENYDPYTGATETNTLSVEYARDPGYYYLLGGNPVLPDEVYHPERNAFNNMNGDKIYDLEIDTIRNAYNSRLIVTNTATGEILRQYESGRIFAPYYTVVFFLEMWMEGYHSYMLNWAPRNVSEGDTLEFRVDTAPEYYAKEDGTVDWDALGDGATLIIPLTMDSTAPTVNSVNIDLEDNILTVEAFDNQYVAAVALYNGSGKQLLSYTGSKEEAVAGETYTYELDLRNANGSKFLIQVYDYAYNITTYELRMELGNVPPLPDMIAFDKEYDYYWTGFDSNALYYNLSIYCETEGVVFTAATIYDHYVFACDEEGDLYVMPESDLSDMVRVTNMGVVFSDMAVNLKDNKIYGVAYNEAGESVLYTIDKMMGTVSEVGVIGINTNTLACDIYGTFYCNEFGTSKVYAFILDTMAQPTYMMEVVNEKGAAFATMGAQAMEYDAETGKVVWISYYYEEKFWGPVDYGYLFEIDPMRNTYVRYNDLGHQLVALVLPQEGKPGDWADPTDEILSMELPGDTVHLLRGYSTTLKVNMLPWNVSNRTVTWTSSDPSVVEVNQYGLVVGHKLGTATITVTSVLDPAFSDSITVVVDTLPVNLEGVVLDDEGRPISFNWNLMETENWTAGAALDTVLLGATKTASGDLLALDSSAQTIVRVDMTTGTSEELGTWDAQFYDMAYSKLFSDENTDRVHMITGSYWIPAKDPANPADDEAWDLFDYIFDNDYAFEFVAIAVGDIVTVEDGGNTYLAEELFLLDDKGYVWKLCAYFDGEFYNSTEPVCYSTNLFEVGFAPTRLDETLLVLCSMVVGEDGNLYLSGFNGKTSVFYSLTVNEDNLSYDAVAFANAGMDIWPAILVDVTNVTTEVVCEHVNTQLRNQEDATCTEDGYTGDTYCADCGELITSGEIIKAHGHELGQWTVVNSTTCTEDGEERSYCAYCDFFETRVIKATGHEMGQWELTTEATCTEDGEERSYCAHCDFFETRVIKATGHEMGQWELTTEATCTEDGEERSYCAHCDYYDVRYQDAKGHEHMLTDSKDATCTEDGYETYACHCGDEFTEVIKAHGHHYVMGTCQHCGHVDNNNPGTGNTTMFFALLVTMFALIGTVVMVSKKRNG